MGIGFLGSGLIFHMVWFDPEEFSGSYFGVFAQPRQQSWSDDETRERCSRTELTGWAGFVVQHRGPVFSGLLNQGFEKGETDLKEKVEVPGVNVYIAVLKTEGRAAVFRWPLCIRARALSAFAHHRIPCLTRAWHSLSWGSINSLGMGVLCTAATM